VFKYWFNIITRHIAITDLKETVQPGSRIVAGPTP